MDTIINNVGQSVLVESCGRCGGRGFIPRYGHNFKGRCFDCDGAGIRSLSSRNTLRVVDSIERHATGRRRRASRAVNPANTDTSESRALALA
jgi:DnaJ-class molecular chaperone